TADTLLSMEPENVEMAFAGGVFEASESGGPTEAIGLLAAAVILLVAFGSVLAMGLPILVALFGTGCGVASIILAANVVDLPGAAVPPAAMLAVGVGSDYSLLMVTRYREGLGSRMEPRTAICDAQDTAGRSVLIAGVTVVIALLGLLVVNMPLVNGMAIGAAVSVAITMAASLTLLPALLGFVGPHIDRWAISRRRVGKPGASWAGRWSRMIQRRPWTYAGSSLL